MTAPVILIPARYASSRYPGKPLVPIAGPDGPKPLIQRTWEAGCAALPAERVFVCTDDERIATACAGFGASVIETPSDCRNGTERCAAAVTIAGLGADVVVNLQGDAPLTPPWFLGDLVDDLAAHPDAQVATPVLRSDAEHRARLLADRAAGRVGGTTAVFGRHRRALYFSKEVLPFVPPGLAGDTWHHVGVYAYRRAALLAYTDWGEGPLERLEGLEQLRFLENGRDILCTEVDARGRRFWELNNPGDLQVIEAEYGRAP